MWHIQYNNEYNATLSIMTLVVILCALKLNITQNNNEYDATLSIMILNVVRSTESFMLNVIMLIVVMLSVVGLIGMSVMGPISTCPGLAISSQTKQLRR